MKTIGLGTPGDTERDIKFAYLFSKWLGIFSYLAAVWIGAFSSAATVAIILERDDLGYSFYSSLALTLLLFGAGIYGLFEIVRGRIYLERLVIPPIIIGLAFIAVSYGWRTVSNILDGEIISPAAGISGAIITGMTFYLILRLRWINRTTSRSARTGK